MRIQEPFHEGELLVQERVGELDEGRRNGAAIGDAIMKGATRFVAQQSMAVLGSIDENQRVWASILFGDPGFMEAENDKSVIFDLTRTARNPHDAVWGNIEHEPRMGVLLLELLTRRRLRINGRVSRSGPDQLRLAVDEAFPNCPKYIQRRLAAGKRQHVHAATNEPGRGKALLPEHRSLLTSADTFFVASANPRGGVDASHRGGSPGFVSIMNETTLRIPDYVGNSMYNTLGNFVLHPHAGLAFVDFDHGRVLQIVGRPVIRWDVEDAGNETGGTRRFWNLEIDHWVESDIPSEITWEFLDYSPHNPK